MHLVRKFSFSLSLVNNFSFVSRHQIIVLLFQRKQTPIFISFTYLKVSSSNRFECLMQTATTTTKNDAFNKISFPIRDCRFSQIFELAFLTINQNQNGNNAINLWRQLNQNPSYWCLRRAKSQWNIPSND